MQLVVWVLIAVHAQALSTEKIWRYVAVYDAKAACQEYAKVAQMSANSAAQRFAAASSPPSPPAATAEEAAKQEEAKRYLEAIAQPEQYVCMSEIVKTMADVPK